LASVGPVLTASSEIGKWWTVRSSRLAARNKPGAAVRSPPCAAGRAVGEYHFGSSFRWKKRPDRGHHLAGGRSNGAFTINAHVGGNGSG
jgi:hypothetical protein